MSKLVRGAARLFGYRAVRPERLLDYVLHQYDSYDEYRDTQIQFNKSKLEHVFADADTLGEVADRLETQVMARPIRGVCHGSRNGFEVEFFRGRGFDVIGTDISDTATDFPHMVQWDFHDENPEWIDRFDFVYSNSLDQGWKPELAVRNWLRQVKRNGYVILELTRYHSPTAASKMDPFGVRPQAFPYVLCDWFGDAVAISFIKTVKKEKKCEAWFFFVRKISDIDAA
jgi:hypothetical protein